MAKPNKAHKARCERYKSRGQREINKALKQEKHKKRMAKFAARREAGKTYEYKPNPYKEGTNDWNRENLTRKEKNKSKKTELQIITSTLRKLKNQLVKEEKEMKLKYDRKDKRRNVDDDTAE